MTRKLPALGAALGALAREGAAGAKQVVDRVAGRGLHGRPLSFERDRVVLIFFEDVERDTFVRGDRHLRRPARRIVRALRTGQNVTGFGVAVAMLVRALERQGYRVVVNDRALARANPKYPVAITGYPHILDGWDLPNPAVLGPGLLDHPGMRPALMTDPRFRWYLAHSDWVRDLFERAWPDRCFTWFAGIDAAEWPDLAGGPKEFDFLLYEKFLWDKDGQRRTLLAPIEAELARRGLRVAHLRYGRYTHESYRDLLARSSALLFLCEHETQGLAYQEALACNVPLLSWDQGRWLDPIRLRYGDREVPASSTPYFSPECGERFAGLSDFGAALDRFLARRDGYRPRAYVARTLSLEESGRVYLEKYAALAQAAPAASGCAAGQAAGS